jgi:hypothetical protein
MPLWMFAILTIAVLSAQAGMMWWLYRKLASSFRPMLVGLAKLDFLEKQAIAEHELLSQHVAPAMGMILRDHDDLKGLLVEALDKKAEEHPLTGLAFLPTDKSSADLEREVRRAEDHAIHAGDPTRFSSRPSPTSGNPSRREPSTQRVPRSGPR